MKRVFLFLALLLLPISTFALNLTYPPLPGGFKLEDATSLPALVAWLYVFFVMISGLAAFVMIIWGGVQWMTSQGNPTATGDAKDKIQKALLGLLLVLTSFLILQIINPELTKLNIPGLSPIPPEEPGLELTLSVNPTSVVSGSNSNVVLTWSGTGLSTTCAASSSPILWEGPKEAAGVETVGPITILTTFTLFCTNSNEDTNMDTVAVGIEPPGGGSGPAPTVDLIIASSLDPGVLPDSPEFYYNSVDLGDFADPLLPLTISWTSSDAVECIAPGSQAENRLSVYIQGDVPPEYEVTINSPNPFLTLGVGETYTFALECFASDGQSATDFFKVTRDAF